MNSTKILILVVLLTASTQVLARILYVKAGSTNPVAPYLTRETAADSIKKATLISLPGDTIFVLKGTYREQVQMKASTSLIGEDRDLTIIDPNTDILPFPGYVVNVLDSCTVKKLTIKQRTISTTGGGSGGIGGFSEHLTWFAKNITVDSTLIMVSNLAAVGFASGKFTNSTVRLTVGGAVAGPVGWINEQDTSTLICENIEARGMWEIFSVLDNQHKRLIFKNCAFISDGDLIIGHLVDAQDVKASFTNCLFLWGEAGRQGNDRFAINNITYDLDLQNCTLAGRYGLLFDYYYGNFTARNTIFSGPTDVIVRRNPGNIDFKYNFFSNSKLPNWLDSTNINGCNTPPAPFSNSTLPPVWKLEWRLDRYSEAIDKGDPSLKDVDGSRSDIGAAGGPGGFSYVYPDLAPQIPDTVWATTNTTTGYYHLYWRKNCEPDFKEYKVYGDGQPGTNCAQSAFLGLVTVPMLATPISRFPSRAPWVNFSVFDSAGNQSVCQYSRPATVLVTENNENDSNREEVEGLQGIYPNPTTGLLNIRYSINSVAKVSLSVFSTTGEETAEVLCHEERQPGTYTQQVQLKAASGVYIVRLVVVNDKREKKEFTQKVSVVK